MLQWRHSRTCNGSQGRNPTGMGRTPTFEHWVLAGILAAKALFRVVLDILQKIKFFTFQTRITHLQTSYSERYLYWCSLSHWEPRRARKRDSLFEWQNRFRLGRCALILLTRPVKNWTNGTSAYYLLADPSNYQQGYFASTFLWQSVNLL